MAVPTPLTSNRSYAERCIKGHLGIEYGKFPEVNGPYMGEMEAAIEKHNRALKACEQEMVLTQDERAKLLQKALIAAIPNAKRFRELPPTTQHDIVQNIVVAFHEEKIDPAPHFIIMSGFVSFPILMSTLFAAPSGSSLALGLTTTGWVCAAALPVAYFGAEIVSAAVSWSKIENLKESALVAVEQEQAYNEQNSS